VSTHSHTVREARTLIPQVYQYFFGLALAGASAGYGGGHLEASTPGGTNEQSAASWRYRPRVEV